MSHMSLVDGMIKLTDVNDHYIISHLKHLTLRVRGIVLHGDGHGDGNSSENDDEIGGGSGGRLSLVANDGLKSVLVVQEGSLHNHNDNGGDKSKAKVSPRKTSTVTGRKLLGIFGDSSTSSTASTFDKNRNIEEIRDEALLEYEHLYDEHEVGGHGWREHTSTGASAQELADFPGDADADADSDSNILRGRKLSEVQDDDPRSDDPQNDSPKEMSKKATGDGTKTK
eukprot:757785_1